MTSLKDIVGSLDVAIDNSKSVAQAALPKTGGKITGDLTFAGWKGVYVENDTSGFALNGGSTTNTGAYLSLRGMTSSSYPGGFILHTVSADGATQYKLIGNNSGTLTWNGQNVITNNYPNAWTFNRDLGHILKSNNTGSMVIRGGGSSDTNGAKLQLYGSENSSVKGDFTLMANDGTQGKTFRGKADGTLTWNSANVLTASNVKAYATETYKSGSTFYRKWSDGWIEQGGIFTGQSPASTSTVTVTFYKPFSDTNYKIFTQPISGDTSGNGLSVQYGHAYYGAVFSKSTTSFTGRGSATTHWYACGY